MRKELAAEGIEVHMLAVNREDAAQEVYQQNLIDKCDFPLMQDTKEDDVWGLLEGGKDDFYIYGPDNVLWMYIPLGGAVNNDLGDPEGYQAIKDLLVQAVAETM